MRMHVGDLRADAISRAKIERSITTLEFRFWRYVDKTDGDGCWNWNATKGAQGYGVIKVAGRFRGAHRVSYELAYGAIPSKLCVLHKCDNPSCVRPDHLFLGTRSDNSTDKVNKGRQARGSRHGATLLTEVDIVEIRRLYLAGETKESIAAKFGLRKRSVDPIVYGENWAHSAGGRVAPTYGSEEWKARIGKAQKGKSFTPEHLANLRAAHAARRGTSRSVPWNVGREWSPEERQRMSEARKGKGGGVALDPAVEAERRRKIAEGRKRYWAAKKAAKESLQNPPPPLTTHN